METGNTVRVHFYSIKFEYLVSDTLGNGGCGWISSDMYAIINVTYSDWQIHRWPEHFVLDIDGDDTAMTLFSLTKPTSSTDGKIPFTTIVGVRTVTEVGVFRRTRGTILVRARGSASVFYALIPPMGWSMAVIRDSNALKP